MIYNSQVIPKAKDAKPISNLRSAEFMYNQQVKDLIEAII